MVTTGGADLGRPAGGRLAEHLRKVRPRARRPSWPTWTTQRLTRLPTQTDGRLPAHADGPLPGRIHGPLPAQINGRLPARAGGRWSRIFPAGARSVISRHQL